MTIQLLLLILLLIPLLLLQGGMFIFDGERCVWSHFDQATGAHADFGEVEKVAQALGSSSKDCGCEA